MAIPFFKSRSKSPEEIVAFDLGGRTTKAVHLQRRGGRLRFVNFALEDVESNEEPWTSEQWANHFRKAYGKLETRFKNVAIGIGAADSLLRRTGMPMSTPADLRMMLKYNAKNYLQQDLPGHIFDCFILPTKQAAESQSVRPNSKCQVMVGAARQEFVDVMQEGARTAGLAVDMVTPNLVGLPNAFELSHNEEFTNEVVALVDIGFRGTTIGIMMKGELCLTRVVATGGDRLTAGISESLGVEYDEAEGIKTGLPDEVSGAMESMLAPLGRELRASIDFFEHQHDLTVTKIYVSGASASSEFIVQMLQTELMVPCEVLGVTEALEIDLPPQSKVNLEQFGSQLTVAIGVALSTL